MGSVEPELRYLRSRSSDGKSPESVSAAALPIILSSGDPMGALYVLMPQPSDAGLDLEVRILKLFARIIGEIVERQRAAIYSAE